MKALSTVLALIFMVPNEGTADTRLKGWSDRHALGICTAVGLKADEIMNMRQRGHPLSVMMEFYGSNPDAIHLVLRAFQQPIVEGEGAQAEVVRAYRESVEVPCFTLFYGKIDESKPFVPLIVNGSPAPAPPPKKGKKVGPPTEHKVELNQ